MENNKCLAHGKHPVYVGSHRFCYLISLTVVSAVGSKGNECVLCSPRYHSLIHLLNKCFYSAPAEPDIVQGAECRYRIEVGPVWEAELSSN